MTTQPERLRHARQRYLDDYMDDDGQVHRYYVFGDYAMCGELVGARDSLPYGDFGKLVELQNVGQLDPTLIPLCSRCIDRIDPPPQRPPWRRRRES